jgi:hypothetical protein
MDSDILFALTLEANEYGIYDEKLIEKLYYDFEKNNYADIDSYINDHFDCNKVYTIQTSIDFEDITDVEVMNELRCLKHSLEYNEYQVITFNTSIPTFTFSSLFDSLMPVNHNQMFDIRGMIGTLVNIEPVQVALTDTALQNLKELKYDEIKDTIDCDDACSICFSNLNEDSENNLYTVLECKHVFHSGCIKEYLKEYSYCCPICKNECGEHEAKI